jgi:hypothetical protein
MQDKCDVRLGKKESFATQYHRWMTAVLKSSLIVLALGYVPASLSAGTIYDNLGPSNSFENSGSYAMTNGFLGTTFVTTGGGSLETVLLPLESVAPAFLTMGLFTNLSGQPGKLLESWTVFETNLDPPPITTLVSVFQPTLTSETQYWFVVSPSPSFVIWYQNNRGVTGGVYGGSSLEALPQSFASLSVPAIQVNSVPEPTSGMLLAVGCFLIAVLSVKIEFRQRFNFLANGSHGMRSVRNVRRLSSAVVVRFFANPAA